ncbi:glycosyltransferase [Vibrio mediterranei]|uniref:Glycosyltransferase n=1 Tax=Vibrio mediterranei TaxID=689 RepID=A0A3G4V924_9VIBR|nr:glycosyltransferase [Vibrio mediterranei]AYV21220.1 glycosyltransferase [Vibrio mediterranei]
MSKPSIIFGVYPWAMVCPGGGERQLLAYKRHLEANHEISVHLFDQWTPNIEGAGIFHFFSVMPGSFQLCEYMKNRGLKLVISPNLWVTTDTMYDYPHDQIWPLMNLADRIIVNSWQEAYSLAEVYGMPIDKFRVVYNGVENGYFEPIVDSSFLDAFGLKKNGYLLNVANIEPRKNQLKFIESMLKAETDLKLAIVGHVRDESYAQKVFDVGGSKVVHVGALEYGSTVLKSAFTNSRAFVMPSTLETPSIAALEASASRIPVLITKEGSTTEYFDKSAIFVDPNSIESMVHGIKNLLSEEHPLEPLSHRFSWSNVVNDLYEHYLELLDE